MKLIDTEIKSCLNTAISQLLLQQEQLSDTPVDTDEWDLLVDEINQWANSSMMIQSVLISGLQCECSNDIYYAIIGNRKNLEVRILLFDVELDFEWEWGKPFPVDTAYEIWNKFLEDYAINFKGCKVTIDRRLAEIHRLRIFQDGYSYTF